MIIDAFNLYNVLIWLGTGLVGGLISSALIRTSNAGGASATFLLSLIGGMVGGLLGTYLFRPNLNEITYQPALLALVGGFILVALQKTLFQDTKYFRTKTS